MTKAIIQTEKLGFEVDGQQILENINLQVNEGDFITIMGASGSGKSTLLKLLGLQIDFSSGSIDFNGKDIHSYDPIEYRKNVSYFFQNAVLFGKTVRDNLAFPSEIRNEEFDEKQAIEHLKEVQLSKDYIDKKVNDLSGGENNESL